MTAARGKRVTGRTLTAREREVLALLGEDKSNKEIAKALSITVGTVKIHVHHILSKLGVTSRTRALAKAALRHVTKQPKTASMPDA
jgi:DNA-binding CsgD family transcriptional regulator